MKKILFTIAMMAMMSCTENARARGYGATITISVESGKKIVSTSWKDGDLWYLVEPMTDEDAPRTLEYIEKSSLGIMEGKIIFVEHR